MGKKKLITKTTSLQNFYSSKAVCKTAITVVSGRHDRKAQHLRQATLKIPLPVRSLARGRAGLPRGAGAQSAIRTAE